LSGPRMVERLREARPELPVLFMTGYADDAAMRDELRAGSDRLLEKPFTARALLNAVQAASTLHIPVAEPVGRT
jgi:two-component system, cell cycle sensor histidine kinase and response regulator CckA